MRMVFIVAQDTLKGMSMYNCIYMEQVRSKRGRKLFTV